MLTNRDQVKCSCAKKTRICHCVPGALVHEALPTYETKSVGCLRPQDLATSRPYLSVPQGNNRGRPDSFRRPAQPQCKIPKHGGAPVRATPATPADVAIMSDNTTSPILQFQKQAILTGAGRGRSFQIRYTATVAATGLRTNCTAYVCSIAGGDSRKPPACQSFALSNISRDATVCLA